MKHLAPMSSPLVSVIIPCYNYGSFLREAIESALNQNYKPVEVIVVNDGSTDETEGICRSFSQRIRYQAQVHGGAAKALNVGIKMSRGDFLYLLSADDRLFPGTIEKEMMVMKEDPACAVVCGDGRLINERGEPIGENRVPLPKERLLLKMLASPHLHDGTLLFRKRALELIDALFFDPLLGDYHIYHYKCFLLARRFSIRYLPEFLVDQGVHTDNMSHPKHVKKMIAGYEILRKEMRKNVTVFDLFEDVRKDDPGEIAKAHFKLGTLFFLFGQYHIAYDDFKAAFAFDRHIFDQKIELPELNVGPFVFPFPVQNMQALNERISLSFEKEKGSEARHVMGLIDRGMITKAFFLCKERLERRPDDLEAKYGLAKTYLRQLQFHDSANRFHDVTLCLLKEIYREAPSHCVDLYLWLAFLDEENGGNYFEELRRRMGRLKFYDLKEMVWIAQNAKVMGKTLWLERTVELFGEMGLPSHLLQQVSPSRSQPTPINREKKKRILFVNPPYRRFLALEAPCFPLSFGSMATLLEEQGYEVGIYDAEYDRQYLGKTGTYEYALTHQHLIDEARRDQNHQVWGEIKGVMERFAPDLVAITAMTNKYPMAERIAEIAKSIDPTIPVVLGGHHPSLYGEKLIRNPNINFVVRGEGELTMAELVSRLFRPEKNFSGVRGLLYKDKGEIRANPPRELIQDLDLLPIPNRDLVLNDHYISGNHLMTSRGCPFHCTYCGARELWGRKVRRRSVGNVLQEVRGLIKRSGSRSIAFWDDSFTCDRAYLRDLMKALRTIDGLSFSCITRLDLVDKEILSLLKEAGCHQILFGIESGSEQILKRMQKGMHKDFIRKKVGEVHSFGIPWLGFFMMGYPGERKEDILETLDFLKELDPSAAEINLFNPLPGTPIWNELEAKGLVHEDMDFSQYSQSSLKNCFVSDLRPEEFKELALQMARAFDEHNQKKSGGKSIPVRKKSESVYGRTHQAPNPPCSLPSVSTPGYTDVLPKQVHFLMIDKCNAKCIMCGGDYYHSRSGRMITLESFKQMASNLRLDRFNSIVLSGAGDPLLNPWLISILQHVRTFYPQVAIAITTNGIGLSPELGQELLVHGIDSINISINAATPEVYKRVMQVDCFDRVCRNVRAWVHLKKSLALKTRVQFSMALHRLNIEDLPPLVDLSYEIGVDSINVMYCRFYPERIRHLNVDREEDRLQDRESLFFHQELSDQLVQRARERAQQRGIGFSHEPLFRERAKAQPCQWPFSEIMVGFNGEVYPCGGAEVHFKEKVEGGHYNFGNVLKDPIERFWNGEDYRRLRLSCRMNRRGPIPECERCANRMNPNDKSAHIMDWDDPQETPLENKERKVVPTESRQPTQRPLVSVIVPTYNRPEMLVGAIRSILNQTYPEVEILVVNDAGIDVEGILTFLNQKRTITYVKHDRNRGLAAARNTGLKLARGKYIAYLDDDDIYFPDHLETLVSGLQTSRLKVAYTDAFRAHQKWEKGRYLVTNRDTPYSFDFDRDRLWQGNFIPVLCVMHEKACLDEVGLFDEALPSHEDWDLWVRMSRKFMFHHIRKVTCEFTWRTDHSNMTSSKKEEMDRTRSIVLARTQRYRHEDERKRERYRDLLALVEQGKSSEAMEGIEDLLETYPDFAEGHNDLGVLYFQKGDREKALALFEKAHHLDPQNREAKKNLADLYLELGRMDEALGLYQEILRDEPDDAETLLKVGLFCLRAGLLEESRRLLERVLALEPDNHVAQEALLSIPKEEPLQAEGRMNGTRVLGQEEEPKVSIIIPVFNHLELTRQCLVSLYRHTQIEKGFELIVVDNGSTDTTPEGLKEACRCYPNLRVLRNERNSGFAKACNQGAKEARGAFLVFLNNDTEPQPGWLKAGLDRLTSEEEIGVVGAKLLYPDRSVQHGGIQFFRTTASLYPLWPLHRYRFASENDPRANEPGEVQAVTGACLFIRRELFEALGGFDEGYGMYFEDTDLCFKARARGKKVYYEPHSVVIHHEGKSSPGQNEIDRLNERAAALFFQRWQKEVALLHLETFIEKQEGNLFYLSPEILPEARDGSFPPADRLREILWQRAQIFKAIGPFYAHFGGAGDALLLLSTFYDQTPAQTVVSIANSVEAMASLFRCFPDLKRVYLIPYPKNYTSHLSLRRIFQKIKNFLGMGVTPSPEKDYFGEWCEDLNIFEKYGVEEHPRWTQQFKGEKEEPFQVTLAPQGSLRGMVGSKENRIDPAQWRELIAFLNRRQIRPIILGTPEERALYPCTGGAVDRRSYSFEDQMKRIASSDLFIGADSWGKTFAALAGVPAIVFYSLRGDDLKGWKDPADYVFLNPWKTITVVKDWAQFEAGFDRLHCRSSGSPVRRTSPQTHYLIKREQGLGDVLMALPVARALKESDPGGKVFFAAAQRYAAVVRTNPYVDDVVSHGYQNGNRVFDLNAVKFGVSDIHQVDAYLEAVGLHMPPALKEIELRITRGEDRRVKRLLRQYRVTQERSKIVLIHAAKGDPNRTWPLENWERLCQIFLDEGYAVIATGHASKDSRRGVHPTTTKGIISLVNALSPLEFVGLCGRAALLVSTDSGPIQLAGASDIAIAGIYTVIPGRCRLPYRRGQAGWKSVAIEPSCEFAGCYRLLEDEKYFGPAREAMKKGLLSPARLFAEWCPAETPYACLQSQITPEMVFDHCRRLLSGGEEETLKA